MEEPTAETVEEVFEEVVKLTPWGFLAWLGFLLPGKLFVKFFVQRSTEKSGLDGFSNRLSLHGALED